MNDSNEGSVDLLRGTGWGRTSDARLFRPALYQLSYSTITSDTVGRGFRPMPRGVIISTHIRTQCHWIYNL